MLLYQNFHWIQGEQHCLTQSSKTPTDWTEFSPETATCYFFMQGVKSNVSKQICVKFLEEGGNHLQKLREELKKSEAEKPLSQFCHMCLLWGHKEDLCYGQCKHFLGWGYDPRICITSCEEIKAKKSKIKAKNKAKKSQF